MALHCYAFQRQRLWLHPYSAEVGVMTLLVNSLVADIGDSSDDIWLINGNHKNTALIGNTTTKQSRRCPSDGDLSCGYIPHKSHVFHS